MTWPDIWCRLSSVDCALSAYRHCLNIQKAVWVWTCTWTWTCTPVKKAWSLRRCLPPICVVSRPTSHHLCACKAIRTKSARIFGAPRLPKRLVCLNVLFVQCPVPRLFHSSTRELFIPAWAKTPKFLTQERQGIARLKKDSLFQKLQIYLSKVTKERCYLHCTNIHKNAIAHKCLNESWPLEDCHYFMSYMRFFIGNKSFFCSANVDPFSSAL